MACCDKITCCEKKLSFFYSQHVMKKIQRFCFVLQLCQQKGFVAIRHDVHVCKLHLYKIH
jgi:hypothetical protein